MTSPPLPLLLQPTSTSSAGQGTSKRPRGRPRKVQRQALVTAVEESKVAFGSDDGGAIPVATVMKRGRGRPRKKALATGTGGANGRVENGTSSVSVSDSLCFVQTALPKQSVSIIEPDYRPSCIDKLVESMLSETNPDEASMIAGPRATKKPVGRPRKRPVGRPHKKPVPVVSSPIKGRERKYTVEGTCASEGGLENIFIPIGLGSVTLPSRLQISKEMVDKMLEKNKVGVQILILVATTMEQLLSL